MKTLNVKMNSIALVLAAAAPIVFAASSDDLMRTSNKVAVNIDNFPRAESDTMLRQTMKVTKALSGALLGQLAHLRAPVPLDKQPVIRMNRDTLYSTGVFDLSKPVTIKLANIGGRYQSMQVVNQDHYMFAKSEPGTYTLTQKNVGSRYAMINIRTLVNSDDAADIKLANDAQDLIQVSGGVVGGEFQAPYWDQTQLTELRQLINQISLFGVNAARGFGKKEDVDSLHYFLGSGSGWGGLPKEEAMYELGSVDNNDGSSYKVTMKDVPVNAFWSITVYNEEGYLQENSLNTYSFNSLTVQANNDGSSTIHFGGCEDKRINCLPISEGWNYAIRYYQPQEQLLSGEWQTPKVVPSK